MVISQGTVNFYAFEELVFNNDLSLMFYARQRTARPPFTNNDSKRAKLIQGLWSTVLENYTKKTCNCNYRFSALLFTVYT